MLKCIVWTWLGGTGIIYALSKQNYQENGKILITNEFIILSTFAWAFRLLINWDENSRFSKGCSL